MNPHDLKQFLAAIAKHRPSQAGVITTAVTVSAFVGAFHHSPFSWVHRGVFFG